jgi:hypothetical protein
MGHLERQVFFRKMTRSVPADALVPGASAPLSSVAPDNQQRRNTRAILATALVARLLVMWGVVEINPRNWLFTRGIEMGLLATSLIHGLGYSSPFGVNTGPTAFIAPGYPTLVAAVFLVFGSDSFASAITIMLLQLVVCLCTIWLMMHVARETFGDRAANVAGAFWAVSIPVLWMPTVFWETSLSACSVMGMIALALRCRRHPTTAAWVLWGATAAIVALINPALLPSILAIMGLVAYETWRVARTAPLLGLLALLLVFSPWPIRNAYRFHAFIPLRSTVGFELWMGNRPGATGYLDVSLFPSFNKKELDDYIVKGEVAYTRGKSEQAWTYIRANPGTSVALTLRRFFRFWTGTGNPNGSPIYPLFTVPTTVLGFAGLVMLYRRRIRCLSDLMALPLLLFPLPYYITHAEFRYRLNIDPLLTILAAYAVTQWANQSAAPKDPNPNPAA